MLRTKQQRLLSGVTREEGGAPGDTNQGSDTLMKVYLFLRLNLQEHWTKDRSLGREGGSGDDDYKMVTTFEHYGDDKKIISF